MKFYGWERGDWREEQHGPPTKHRKIKSRHRREARRIAKKRIRLAAKLALTKGED